MKQTGIDLFTTKGPYVVPFDGTPCVQCPTKCSARDFSLGTGKTDHEYLYSIGTRDFYRCHGQIEGRRCTCGSQYELRGIPLADDREYTEAEIRALMLELEGGGGEVVNPKRIF